MSDLVKQVNQKEAESLIKENNTVVIDFWAIWCPPCIVAAPIFEKMAGKYNGVLFLKVNTDENPDMANDLNISSIPTFIIFKSGKEFTRVVGLAPDKLEKAIFQALN